MEKKYLPTPEDPLKLVEDEISNLRYFSPLKDGRFSGGAVGYLSYEYANRVEPTVPLPPKDELGLPLGTVKAQLFRARDFLSNMIENTKDTI